jgi:hypothetical protein
MMAGGAIERLKLRQKREVGHMIDTLFPLNRLRHDMEGANRREDAK